MLKLEVIVKYDDAAVLGVLRIGCRVGYIYPAVLVYLDIRGFFESLQNIRSAGKTYIVRGYLDLGNIGVGRIQRIALKRVGIGLI